MIQRLIQTNKKNLQSFVWVRRIIICKITINFFEQNEHIFILTILNMVLFKLPLLVEKIPT